MSDDPNDLAKKRREVADELGKQLAGSPNRSRHTIVNTPWNPEHFWMRGKHLMRTPESLQIQGRKMDLLVIDDPFKEPESKIPNDRADAMLWAMQAQLGPRERNAGIEGMLSAADAERLELIERGAVTRKVLSRRGSWFRVPNVPWEVRAGARPRRSSSGLSTLSMEEQKKLGAEEKAWDEQRERWKATQDKNGTAPDLVKQDKFVLACDVTCLHCLIDQHFEKVLKTNWPMVLGRPTLPEEPEAIQLFCPNCKNLLWPLGGWQVANVARRLTGDFAAFNMMLMHPPEPGQEGEAR